MYARLISKRGGMIGMAIGLPVVSFYLSLVLLNAYMPTRLQEPAPKIQSVNQVKNVVHIQAPQRLKISTINLDASIKPVGVTSEGDMDIDKSPIDVAWYKDGPMPGQKGSAVIAGHYGWKEGVASVFNDIHTLKKGDEVSVIDERSNLITFVVQKTQKYDPAADTKDVFTSGDGKAHLNLITCGGTWDEARQTYTERLVVFTDKKT